MLSNALEALKTYDWGTDRAVLAPIDEAVISTHDDEASRQELEASLAAVLSTPVSRDAKDYVCRKLMVIGTAASVPALARLLPEEEHSHMARFAARTHSRAGGGRGHARCAGIARRRIEGGRHQFAWRSRRRSQRAGDRCAARQRRPADRPFGCTGAGRYSQRSGRAGAGGGQACRSCRSCAPWSMAGSRVRKGS